MTAAQVREAVRRYESGESLVRVSERLGFNAQTISNQLRKQLIRLRDPHERPGPLDAQLHEQHASSLRRAPQHPAQA